LCDRRSWIDPVELYFLEIGKFAQTDLIRSFENGFRFAGRQSQEIAADRSEEQDFSRALLLVE
jgi:hypothetical protein